MLLFYDCVTYGGVLKCGISFGVCGKPYLGMRCRLSLTSFEGAIIIAALNLGKPRRAWRWCRSCPDTSLKLIPLLLQLPVLISPSSNQLIFMVLCPPISICPAGNNTYKHISSVIRQSLPHVDQTPSTTQTLPHPPILLLPPFPPSVFLISLSHTLLPSVCPFPLFLPPLLSPLFLIELP